MSDIMDDLRRVEGDDYSHPVSDAERLFREEDRRRASRYLLRHAPDLHEMVMGVASPLEAL